NAVLDDLPDLPEWQTDADMGFVDALRRLHANPYDEAARGRIAFDEALANQLAIAMSRANFKRETGAMVVDRLLADRGFAYTHTGSFTSNFYLARIKRTGVGAGVTIPADLIETLHNDGYVENGNQDDNSLGEKDYFVGSGWMYSKNGSFPGYGFTDTKLKDGDVVKIRYTLAYGKDIGGGQSSGGSSSDNYGKVW
ncbi:MAG: DUF4430 domain-containing protein, partial [Clostridiales Family XIII bacterium]|nr:DUF4430 domain-containing protein [Clostridiales Family XIII bacterium]